MILDTWRLLTPTHNPPVIIPGECNAAHIGALVHSRYRSSVATPDGRRSKGVKRGNDASVQVVNICIWLVFSHVHLVTKLIWNLQANFTTGNKFRATEQTYMISHDFPKMGEPGFRVRVAGGNCQTFARRATWPRWQVARGAAGTSSNRHCFEHRTSCYKRRRVLFFGTLH